MRRVMMLVLLGMALPTAALAQTCCLNVPTSFSSGTFNFGTVSAQNASGGFNLNASPIFVVDGSMFHIRLDEKFLSDGCQTDGTCTFGTGSIRVVGPQPSNVVKYQDPSVIDGTMIKTGDNVMITADIKPNPLAIGGGLIRFDVTLGTTGSLAGGAASVTAVPEPGTLALLGTSVIGLAGMARRRLRLGK